LKPPHQKASKEGAEQKENEMKEPQEFSVSGATTMKKTGVA
jgi:hypothetical protein